MHVENVLFSSHSVVLQLVAHFVVGHDLVVGVRGNLLLGLKWRRWVHELLRHLLLDVLDAPPRWDRLLVLAKSA